MFGFKNFFNKSPIDITNPADDNYSFSGNIRQMKNVEQHGKTFKYTPEQKQAISSYINDSEKIREDPQTDKNLSDAIKSNRTKRDIYVHRGTFGKEATSKVGDVINFNQHTSTSYHPSIASQFKGRSNNAEENGYYRIRVPEGSSAAHLGGNEHELLLHKGAKIKVTKRELRHDNGKPYIHHEAELIDDASN